MITLKILRHKITGKFHVREYEYTGSAYNMNKESIVDTLEEAKKIKKHYNRLANKREENAMLRELCGTSARAARKDMGL